MSEANGLSDRMAAWCVAAVPGASRLVAVERLYGGLGALSYLITLECDHGSGEWVLRSGLKARTNRTPGEEITKMAGLSKLLSRHPQVLRVPVVVAYDASGEQSGEPALLMTRLPGCADVSRQNAASNVEALARALARFHAARLTCPPEYGRYEVEFERRNEPVPHGIVAPDWQRAFDELRALNVTGAQLIHSDFHMGNVLFDAGVLTGIVDWADARRGPPQFDVGYCRADLSMILGIEAADRFLSVYEAERGEPVCQRPLWDLAGAVEAFPDPKKWLRGWLELGRQDLDAELVRERLTQFVERALAEL